MTNLLLLSRWALSPAAHQAPPSLGFSRQEHWSGLPFPSPMINLDSILKSRDITLPTKVRLVRAVVFLVVMCACDSRTIKKVSTEELVLLYRGVGEDSGESLGLQGVPTSQS